MAADIQLKRSSVSGKRPDAGNIAVGEPVVNLTDRILYTKDGTGNVVVIGANLTVQVVDAANTATTSVADVRTLQFDANSGFDVIDRANGIAKVQMNSTFKTWNVYGQANLVADGLDTVNIVAGDYITITTNPSADPQQIRFSLSNTLTTSNVIEGANLYFTNARANTAISSQTLGNATFAGHVVLNGNFTVDNGAGGGGTDEGGQINLATATTNSTLNGPIAIDIYQNRFRIFETTGSNRGVYIDITATSNGAGTNLLTGGGGGSGTITSVAGVSSGGVSNAQLAAATVYSQTLTNATFSANVTADRFISNNNGNGENYKVGDDVWIGDTNLANTLRIKGQQDATYAYINFGNNDGKYLGRAGSGALTYNDAFTVTGNVSTGNVSGTAGTFTYSRLGTVESGTWQGTSISTTYTDAKIVSVSNTAPIGATTTAGAVAITHLNSGVTAATYGNSTHIPAYTVNATGHITSASNVAIAIPSSALTTDVALGTQTSGAYVSNLVAGTGVTLTGLGNEGTTPTISIGQAVGTNNNVTFANLTVTGNLTVQGNAVIFESNTLVITDPLIQVGKNPAGDAVDLGFFGHYIGGSPSTERHAGLFRDATDGQFKLFTNLDPEPTTIVDTANASYQSANLVVNFVVGKVSDISNHTTASLAENSANLYYTNARVYSNVIQIGYATNSNVALKANLADLTTANVTEVNNLYFTNARVYANVVAAGFYDTVSNTAPIGATEAGTTLTLTHLDSGVTAGTYGNATIVPIITVDARGHITSVANVTITASGGGSTTTVSSTPPASPNNGDIWVDSDTGSYFIYLNDGTSSQWVEFNTGGSGGGGGGGSSSVYADSNVITLLSSFSNNFITTTGNVNTGNVNVTSNIAAGNVNVTGVMTAGLVAASGAIFENAQNITANTTITSGRNAMSAGPITINTGQTVTVSSGSRWVIV